MGLGGLWHGASLNFVAWGLYHGALLAGTHHRRRRGLSLPRPIGVAVTFILVVLGWVLFRMRSAHAIGQLYAGMFGLHGIGGLPGHLALYIAIAAAIVFGLPEEWRWPVGRWNVAYVARHRGALRSRGVVRLHKPSVHLLPLLMKRLILFLVVTGAVLGCFAAVTWWVDPLGEIWKPGALVTAQRDNCLISQERRRRS
jgi:hypothetical protein